MTSRIQVTLGAALAALAVTAGGALANGYGDHPAPAPAPPPAGGSGQEWQAFKQLESSRLTQVAYLTGLAEIDDQGEDDNGDPNAKGSANLLQVDERTVCYGFMVTGAEAPTAVHIHRGVAGTNGPVVLEFSNVPKDDAGAAAGDPGASSGCKTVETPEEMSTLRRIRKNPANYYLNIHTPTFPDGAVRGQLGSVWYDNEA